MVSLDYSTTVLDNGLSVILHPNHETPVVAMVMMVHAGSRNEAPGNTGIAHLFEHLMFKGSQHVADGEFFRLLQEVGAAVNAATGEDRTYYYDIVPRNALELALFLESDRLGTLPGALSQEKLENQRSVVLNERRQRYENQPYGMVPELLSGVFFPGRHPYRWPVIGYPEDLRAAGLADLQEFFGSWYTPGNVCLSLAGDFEPGAAMRLVERWFGSIPAGSAPLRTVPSPVAVERDRRVIHEDSVNLPRLILAWPAPRFLSGGEAAMDTLTAVLGEGKNSRLTMSLVTTRRIAQSVRVYSDAMELQGMAIVDVTAKPGVCLADIEQEVTETIGAIAAEGVSEEEFSAAHASIARDLVQRRLTAFGRAYGLALYHTAGGDAGLFNRESERYEAVTQADVRAAASLLCGAKVAISVVPQGSLDLVANGGRA